MFVFITSTIWVLLCSIWNAFIPRVPNWLTTLGIFLALLFRWNDWLSTGLVPSQVFTIFIAWGAAFILWRIRWMGGGDAKFFAAIVLAFPDSLMIAFVLIGDIAGLLVYSLKRDGLRWANIKNRLAGNLEEFQESSDRLRATTFMGIGWLVWAAMNAIASRS
jgi:Flp pilus assembly protein protease CpaA